MDFIIFISKLANDFFDIAIKMKEHKVSEFSAKATCLGKISFSSRGPKGSNLGPIWPKIYLFSTAVELHTQNCFFVCLFVCLFLCFDIRDF